MRTYHCQKCGGSETVSDECDRMTHFHNGLLFKLEEFPVGIYDVELPKRQVQARLEAIEFTPGKIYMVLFDPFSIDVTSLEDVVKKYMPESVKIVFVPCSFNVTQSGFISETITLDSLEVIEQWLEEKKYEMLIRRTGG